MLFCLGISTFAFMKEEMRSYLTPTRVLFCGRKRLRESEFLCSPFYQLRRAAIRHSQQTDSDEMTTVCLRKKVISSPVVPHVAPGEEGGIPIPLRNVRIKVCWNSNENNDKL
ncbi:hypothetical protein CEXT_272861 [Caerostris extrusa]|uniref:Uncharacterized protein n=1 Tax=Caerostris extrusa TaxID=172846 RepID=A0AAV4VEW4_CAEEX|nr:hypothetical protein CEXT_272861 [Caerostris extrusa]